MIKQTDQGAVRILSVEGVINEEQRDELLQATDPANATGRPQFVLDLAETTLIDSRGCETLLDLRDQLVAVGGSVHLSGLSPLCQDILTATGVDRSFRTFEGVPQAVAQYAK